MTLETRIAAIVAHKFLTPEERAASILAQPEMGRLRESDDEIADRVITRRTMMKMAFELAPFPRKGGFLYGKGIW